MMTPSYSRMTNLLFWSLLLGSLLAILAFEFGPERRLDILSQAGIAARAQDDRSHGGHSVTTLLAAGGKPAIDCKLSAGYASPFCELILTLSVSIHRNSIDTGKMRRSSLDPTFLLA